MKQVDKSTFVLEKLKAAELNADEMVVFEAIALNTQPIRKKHPLFFGAVHDRTFLQEMAQSVNGESLPLQLMHDSSVLPVGRVFYGEVKDTMEGSELRVLFAVDKSQAEYVGLIENGTVNQVSVSFLAKAQHCSECGFDFFGDEATFDHLWSGTCENGHTMGQDGAHLRAKGLDSWFEMSLVGKGGAQGAKIVSKDRQAFKDHRLAATGMDLTFLSSNFNTKDIEELNMDITKLVTDLTDAKAQNLQHTAAIQALTATLDATKAELTQATEKLVAAETALAAATTASTSDISQEQYDLAVNALKDIATKVLVATGELDPKLDDKSVADLAAAISGKAEALVTALAEAGKSKDTVADADKATSTFRISAY